MEHECHLTGSLSPLGLQWTLGARVTRLLTCPQWDKGDHSNHVPLVGALPPPCPSPQLPTPVTWDQLSMGTTCMQPWARALPRRAGCNHQAPAVSRHSCAPGGGHKSLRTRPAPGAPSAAANGPSLATLSYGSYRKGRSTSAFLLTSQLSNAVCSRHPPEGGQRAFRFNRYELTDLNGYDVSSGVVLPNDAHVARPWAGGPSRCGLPSPTVGSLSNTLGF